VLSKVVVLSKIIKKYMLYHGNRYKIELGIHAFHQQDLKIV
jgi:hypothetical protein